MPDDGFDPQTITNLGRGVSEYFAGLYPLKSLSFQDRLRGLIDHFGTQKAAAAAVGISPRQIRRWGHGVTPKAASQERVDRTYLSIHLQLNGHQPVGIEAKLAAAFSAGASYKALGKIMEKFLIRNRVPRGMIAHTVPGFTRGMGAMYIDDCTISTDGDRGAWPFNIGTYAA